MALSQRRSRPGYVLAVLVLGAVTLVTLDSRGNAGSVLHRARHDARTALSSVQTGVHEALRPIGNFLTGAADYGALRSDNERLRQEIAADRSSQYRAEYDQRQADQVLAFSHIPFAAAYRTVVAGVTDQPSSNFDETVTIGKGASSGIAVGQPVVTPTGLAGQVSAVSAGSATVTLITDPQLVVGVALPGGNIGSAQSLGPGQGLAVDVIAASVAAPELEPGAVLFTSEAGQAFPPGIPVGTVSNVRRVVANSQPSITVHPFAGTAGTGYLTVLLWLPT